MLFLEEEWKGACSSKCVVLSIPSAVRHTSGHEAAGRRSFGLAMLTTLPPGSGTLHANMTHRYRLLPVPDLCNSYCIELYLLLQFAGSVFPNKDSFRSSYFFLRRLQYAPTHESVPVSDRLVNTVPDLP